MLPVCVLLGLGCLAQLDPALEHADTDSTAVAEASETKQNPQAARPTAAATTPDEGHRGLDIAWLPASITRYEEQIIAAAQTHGIDPQLVAIVVLVESRGNPEARSPTGARGLMQVMPQTAAEIARVRGLRDHQESDLDDPQYNLDLGTWFLARQLESFGAGQDDTEAISLAAAAYNAGPDRLRASLVGQAELSDESTRYSNLVTTLWSERDQERSSLLK